MCYTEIAQFNEFLLTALKSSWERIVPVWWREGTVNICVLQNNLLGSFKNDSHQPNNGFNSLNIAHIVQHIENKPYCDILPNIREMCFFCQAEPNMRNIDIMFSFSFSKSFLMIWKIHFCQQNRFNGLLKQRTENILYIIKATAK